MAMFLAGVPAETIQLIGRWRSQTFMRYIRIQVQQMTRGVADVMTANPEFFMIDRKEGRLILYLRDALGSSEAAWGPDYLLDSLRAVGHPNQVEKEVVENVAPQN